MADTPRLPFTDYRSPRPRCYVVAPFGGGRLRCLVARDLIYGYRVDPIWVVVTVGGYVTAVV